MSRVLVIDAANVVGSRPDGWWKDRARAARRLHEQVLVADLAFDRVVLVLEGQAKAGVRAGTDLHVDVVHAPRDGDSAILAVVQHRLSAGHQVVVVTADRVLGTRAENIGARTMSPGWLLDQV